MITTFSDLRLSICQKESRYYSTNRHLDQVPGITPFRETVSFREALLMGQAPDEGLFMPETIPVLPVEAFKALKGAPYTEAAMLVAQAFLAGEIAEQTLRRIIDDAYNYEVPLENVFARKYVMRLDQGPTASFKDFAARMMARLMSAFRDPGKRLNVLVATSGDTGSAVGEAFKGVEGIDVTILYPRGEVSGRQKKQLDTIGGTSGPSPWTGSSTTARISSSRPSPTRPSADFNLTSANSINFGRILPADRLLCLGLGAALARRRAGRLLRPVGQLRRRPRLRVRPADGPPRGEARHADERKRRISPLPGDRRL